mmetsp:Transcript_32098/g.84078  ORF Transcript_32098/g.84078 Transcript_32098/m.84078 type:complete len:461 (-) Transcript_32098:3006-4388(-)
MGARAHIRRLLRAMRCRLQVQRSRHLTALSSPRHVRQMLPWRGAAVRRPVTLRPLRHRRLCRLLRCLPAGRERGVLHPCARRSKQSVSHPSSAAFTDHRGTLNATSVGAAIQCFCGGRKRRTRLPCDRQPLPTTGKLPRRRCTQFVRRRLMSRGSAWPTVRRVRRALLSRSAHMPALPRAGSGRIRRHLYHACPARVYCCPHLRGTRRASPPAQSRQPGRQHDSHPPRRRRRRHPWLAQLAPRPGPRAARLAGGVRVVLARRRPARPDAHQDCALPRTVRRRLRALSPGRMADGALPVHARRLRAANLQPRHLRRAHAAAVPLPRARGLLPIARGVHHAALAVRSSASPPCRGRRPLCRVRTARRRTPRVAALHARTLRALVAARPLDVGWRRGSCQGHRCRSRPGRDCDGVIFGLVEWRRLVAPPARAPPWVGDERPACKGHKRWRRARRHRARRCDPS